MKAILFLLLIVVGATAAAAAPQINCQSWRLAVETNNIRDWTVPAQCKGYVSEYMTGQQYRDDCNAVVNAAIEYARTLNVSKEGKDLWVFNIDETTLSNVPYYARPEVGFGTTRSNMLKFESWIKEGKSPAIPSALILYKTLLDLGIKPIFITDTKEELREVRMTNLKKVGYHSWFKFISKGKNDSSVYSEHSGNWKTQRRAELVKAGYRLVGNLGGWDDIIIDFLMRTFKMPNPMYYF